MNTLRPLGTTIVRMAEVTSTMVIARRLESLGAAEGTTIVAASQTQGRGRSDRVWISPRGTGLYCSVLLRPQISPEQFRPFSIAAGLAICETLDPDHLLGIQIKWPNDILYRDRKLAGVLITSSLSGSTVDSAILGFGLNFLADPTRPEIATSLDETKSGPKPIAEELMRQILDAIADRYTMICKHETSVISDWPDRLAYLDQPVTLQDGQTSFSGILEGLDHSGALLLGRPFGTQAITSGELTRGPVPS